MTKAELIRYGDGFAKVCWKVYFSDNGSTDVDVGSVEFRAYGDGGTLVTFHSAYKIRTGGIPIPGPILGPMLSGTFLDHLEQYRFIFSAS